MEKIVTTALSVIWAQPNTEHTANSVSEPGRQVYDIEKVFKSKKLFTTQAVVSSGLPVDCQSGALNLIIDFG